MGLFLDGIFDSSYSSPSKVTIEFPEYNVSLKRPIKNVLSGLLASETSISTGNKWGPVIPDVSTLSDISSIMGDSEIFSWIGASTNCWKGTNAISLSLDIYLINYKRDLDLEYKMKALTKLTSLTEADSNVKVVTHGGYMADVLSTNKGFFTSNWKDIKSGGDQLKDYFLNSDVDNGTVTVSIGNEIKLSNLLVSKIDITPSTVEVVDKKPLFYRMGMSLIGARPLLSTDVDTMFK